MVEAVCLALLGVPDEGTDEGLGGQFVTHLVRDVDKRAAAGNAEAGDVGPVAALCFFGGGIRERASWRDIVEGCGVVY